MSSLYPLDSKGILTSNVIKNEVHTLHPVSEGQFNFIVPNAAPFHNVGVEVLYFTGDIPATEIELDSLDTTPLQLGVDYLLTHRTKLPSSIVETPTYSSISFIDIGLEGNVILRYRTLGSELVMNESAITKLLAQKTTDPRSVYWEDVVIDIVFPPSHHLDNAEDFVGMDALVEQLRALQVQIAGGVNNEHYHEITHVRGLVDALAQGVSNRGPNKFNVGPHFHFEVHQGVFDIVIPEFDNDTHVNVKFGLVGSTGASIITIHADISSDTEIGQVVPNTVAYFEDTYLSDQAVGHQVYRHTDGTLRIALDIGRLENVMSFVHSVALNTANARVYTDSWGITDLNSEADPANFSALDVLTGGGLRMDFATTGELKPNTAWMVLSHNGAFTRTLPDNAPDNSVILVRDHGDNASVNKATTLGNILYAGSKEATGLELDNSRGWFKLQFSRITSKWHVVSGT